jgi:hypothetical protein
MAFQEPSRSVGSARIKFAYPQYVSPDGSRWAKAGHDKPFCGCHLGQDSVFGYFAFQRCNHSLHSTEFVMFSTSAGLTRWLGTLSIGCIALCSGVAFAGEGSDSKVRSVQVTGSGTDLLNGAIIHSKKDTPTGMIEKSTEIVELKGDLIGRVLYHVTSKFDTANNTLVNTGDQVFSGTIAGSEPVMIHDGRFSFHANLKTGAEKGTVYLFDHIAGPRVQCTLHVVGTGKDADANPTFDYTGQCDFRDK